MISDEPDEDADFLDDNALVEAVIGPIMQPSIRGDTPAAADWPPQARQSAALTVDGDILAWFKARDANWQSQACAVLRAWIAAQAPPGT